MTNYCELLELIGTIASIDEELHSLHIWESSWMTFSDCKESSGFLFKEADFKKVY